MRILIVSNLYPPHVLGGYELGCRDVAAALESRGHQIRVLTSCFGVGSPTTDGRVWRWLHATGFGSDADGPPGRRELLRRELRNQLAFDRALQAHRPDVVHLWNLAKIPTSLALRAEARSRACYYVSDEWLARWTEPGWYEDAWYRANRGSSRLRSRMTRGVTRSAFSLARLTWTTADLQLRHVQFCSAFMKEATLRAGRPVEHAQVVHWGVDVATFTPPDGGGRSDRHKRLLYVGQLLPHKGVHTAIEAIRRVRDSGVRDLTFTIVGACHQPDYESQLRAQVAASRLEDVVRFAGRRPRTELPGIYHDHGVLLFPSCWDEPFAITPLEAMASELAVVGTLAGGNGEMFDESVTALTFPAEDAGACAAQVHRLVTDPALVRSLGQTARRTVCERFTLERMVDRIECGLRAASAASRRTSQGHVNGA